MWSFLIAQALCTCCLVPHPATINFDPFSFPTSLCHPYHPPKDYLLTPLFVPLSCSLLWVPSLAIFNYISASFLPPPCL
eukprot:m.352587 g.352587  ORF g.352587 m.352587 type:complete len:79 (+) comp16555_c0_seq1:526-762(+)